MRQRDPDVRMVRPDSNSTSRSLGEAVVRRDSVDRPIATIILALVSAIAALASLVVTLQFLEVLPWGEDDFDFWGGKWAGVFLFGLVTLLACLVCYGWLTLKPWAFTITILMALIGLSIPVSALFAGTETWSTAL